MKSTRLMIVFCGCLAAGALWPAEAAAQRRGGGGSGGGGGGGSTSSSRAVPRTHPPVVNNGGGYYRPYYGGYYRPAYYGSYYAPFYGGFYGSFGFYSGGFYAGYAPYYAGYGYGYGYAGYPYYAQYPYPYPYTYARSWATVRLELKPRDAQVFLDGYLVGNVDQFDGTFQRLDLPTGEHEIEVYMKGFKPYKQRTLFRPGESYNFKGILEPLPAGTAEEPPPQPSANQPDPYSQPQRDPREPYDRDPGEQGRTRPMPNPDRPGDHRAPDSSGFGTLNVRVQPGDAIVVIDGERWDSPEGGSRLSVQLSAGSHRIEVRKDGFKPYSSTIQIRPGDSQSLNISLPQGVEGAGSLVVRSW